MVKLISSKHELINVAVKDEWTIWVSKFMNKKPYVKHVDIRADDAGMEVLREKFDSLNTVNL